MNEIKSINDFVKRIRERFPSSFREDNTYNIWSEDCVKYLYNEKVDYEKLYKIAVTENPEKSESFAPGMNWLKNQLGRCYKKEEKKTFGDLLHVKVYDPRKGAIPITDHCFPKGTTEEQMIKTFEKRFKCTGWKIIDIFSY